MGCASRGRAPRLQVEGAKGQRAASATLLNQLLSFAAVAGIAMRLGAMWHDASFPKCPAGEAFRLPLGLGPLGGRLSCLRRSGAMQTRTFREDLQETAKDTRGHSRAWAISIGLGRWREG